MECANAGAVPGSLPDDHGNGYSTACGDDADAVGDGSIALGDATAEGDYSIAMGSFPIAAGDGSIAIGYSTDTYGAYSLGVGQNVAASDAESTALGYNARSYSNNSTALGHQATASNFGGLALGYLASACGQLGTALGYDNYAGSLASTALGYKAQVDRDYAIVLGSIQGVNGAPKYADVAIGTTIPLAPLHVFRHDGTAQVLVEETSMDAVPRTLFRLASAGSNAKFEIDNTLAGVNWAFTNSGGDFRISRQGSGIIEFRVCNNGDAYIAGDLELGGDLYTNVLLPSDRNLKHKVEAIEPEAVLDQVASLSVGAGEYTDRPGERHIGPMAQDFRAAFGLGADDTSISVVDGVGVAIASIQALEARNRDLEARNAALEERLTLVEAWIMQLLPQTAQN
jgi:hypothetical protein